MGRTRTILIKESKKRKIELQVNPSEVSVSDSMNNEKLNIAGYRTINVPGNQGLKSIKIDTFLPAENSPFYAGKSPESILKLISRWKKKKKAVRIIISGTDINMKVILDATIHSYREGCKDVYVNWSFSEYIEVSVPTVESVEGLISVSDPVLSERPAEEAPQSGAKEVVNSKTTLWSLAVKYYQDGTQWTKIAAANGNIDPKKLQVGMELIIP